MQPEKYNIGLVIKTLNEALLADRDAVQTLFHLYVDANEKLANHPYIQVKTKDSVTLHTVKEPDEQHQEENYIVGVLGFINGVIEPITGSRVAVVKDDKSGEITGFMEYVKP